MMLGAAPAEELTTPLLGTAEALANRILDPSGVHLLIEEGQRKRILAITSLGTRGSLLGDCAAAPSNPKGTD